MGIGRVGTSISTTRCILKEFPAHGQISQGFFINSHQIKFSRCQSKTAAYSELPARLGRSSIPVIKLLILRRREHNIVLTAHGSTPTLWSISKMREFSDILRNALPKHLSVFESSSKSYSICCLPIFSGMPSVQAATRREQHSPFTFTTCVLTLHLRRAQICFNS